MVDSGNYVRAYDYLSARDYAYADWANGVAQVNTFAGISALEFLGSSIAKAHALLD